MFKEWGFLLGEIWVLLALAALIGLVAGWLIWGGRKSGANAEMDGLRADLERARGRADAAEAEAQAAREAAQAASAGAMDADTAAQLRAQLDSCHDARSEAEDRIEALEAQLSAGPAAADADLSGDLARSESARAEAEARAEALEAQLATAQAEAGEDLSSDLAACRSAQAEAEARIATLEGDLAACEAARAEAPVASADGFVDVGRRPEGLSAARGGQADDLKLIKGVGPKLEKLCNSLGFWHFDQVAAWTDDEIAWVDENLEGFKGRVSRDEWVAQAKDLAEGRQPGE